MGTISKKIHVLDVKEPIDFTSKFQYNFFTVDESINEEANNQNNQFEKFLEQDIKIQQHRLKKLPRYVQLNWTMPSVLTFGKTISLSQNVDKILSEDYFSGGTFCKLQTKDQHLTSDAYYTFSSGTNLVSELNDILFEEKFSSFGIKGSDEITEFISDIKNIKFDLMLNSQVSSELLNIAKLNTPNCRYPAINKSIEDIKTNNDVIGDFDVELPYLEVRSGNTIEKNEFELVGFIIKKFEIEDDIFIEKKQIVINSVTTREFIDRNVKYGSTYQYQISAVYVGKLPATNIDTNQQSLLTILVSSQSITTNVECFEYVQPSPPNDVSFVWEYGKPNKRNNTVGRLMIHWTFPVEQQRDIKYFQVMRRRTTSEPFELVKMFDFNDAAKIPELQETYETNIIEKQCKTYWYDEDFIKSSRFIYTVCSVDAHGYISHYGPQYELWFDIHRNKLQKSLVSHSGAPRPYPNIFIENELFVDTIKTSGGINKTLDVYFDPECYNVSYDSGNIEKTVLTDRDGATYRLQLINLDNQKDQVITMIVNDKFNLIGTQKK